MTKVTFLVLVGIAAIVVANECVTALEDPQQQQHSNQQQQRRREAAANGNGFRAWARATLASARRITDAVVDLAGGSVQTAGERVYDAGHAAAAAPIDLLGGATAKGLRDRRGAAGAAAGSNDQKKRMKAAARLQQQQQRTPTFESRLGAHMDAAVAWVTRQAWADDGDDDGTPNTAAATTTSNVDENENVAIPTSSVGRFDSEEAQALSRVHMRAAEALASDRRRGVHTYPADDADVSAMSHGDYDQYTTTSIDGAIDDPNARWAHHESLRRRSEERIVNLLKRRKAALPVTSKPEIAPEFLPDFAKPYSGYDLSRRRAAVVARGAADDEDQMLSADGTAKDSRGEQSQPQQKTRQRTFGAQQASFARPRYNYCHDGLPVTPSTTNYTCNTTSGIENKTAFDYIVLSKADRDRCVPQSSRQACICPRDSFAGRTAAGDTLCFWKQIECSVERLSPAECPELPIDEPLRIQRCITIPREGQLTVSVNVTCRFAYVNPRDYAFYGIDVIPEPPVDDPEPTFVVITAENTTQPIIRNISNIPFAPYGTYQQISDAMFLYTEEPYNSIMPLTAVHPAVGRLGFYMRPIDFNRVSDRQHQQTFYVGDRARYRFYMLTGGVPVTFTVNFANISSAFVHGNRVFLEVGVRGDDYGLLPSPVIAAPFTVDFNNLPEPPLRSNANSDTVVIIIVVCVVCAVVAIAAIVAGIFYCRWKERREKMKAKQE